MNLLPAFASTSNIADLFTRPLPIVSHHRYTHLVIGDATTTTTPSTSVATATVDPSTLVAPTVDSSTATLTVVASASAPTASDSVALTPNLDPAPLPVNIDTGASHSVASFASDFLPVAQTPYGLTQSPITVLSKALASTPIDPYTLITGEDTATDLSFPDSDSVDTVEFASTLVYSSFRHFGTATLVFLSDANSKLITILVEPQVDWLHWIPLPRLTPTESYFHICGRDYLQAFVLLHLIPIWITLVSALVSALLRSE